MIFPNSRVIIESQTIRDTRDKRYIIWCSIKHRSIIEEISNTFGDTEKKYNIYNIITEMY